MVRAATQSSVNAVLYIQCVEQKFQLSTRVEMIGKCGYHSMFTLFIIFEEK
jgi:hypothetical protein